MGEILVRQMATVKVTKGLLKVKTSRYVYTSGSQLVESQEPLFFIPYYNNNNNDKVAARFFFLCTQINSTKITAQTLFPLGLVNKY